MKHQSVMRGIILIAMSLTLVFPPANAGQTQEPKDRKDFIDMEDGSYCVAPPPSKGWAVEVDTKSACVHFLNKKKYLKIDVLRDSNSVKGSWHRLKEEEIAGKLFDDIEESARHQTWSIVGWGPPRIGSLKKGETLLDEKKIFFMSYTEDRGPAAGKTDFIWYYYFPPDFKKTFQFYAFRISQFYDGHIEGIDPEPAYAVIRSLQIRSPFAAVPGLDGELLRAAAEGRNDRVKELLDKGAQANASWPEGAPLAAAAYYGHPETVQILIDRGADVQGKESKYYASPLFSAIAGGEVQIARLLIDRGADIHAKTTSGMTILARAADSAPELVPTLVEKGADVNAKTAEGRTPLFYAAWIGNAEIVPFLIDHKADLNIPMNNGWTPLMQALDTSHFEIARLLLDKGADVNLKADTGWTVLMAAVMRGAGNDLIKALLEHGADANARWKNGRTPLMLSVHGGRTDVARLLIDRGADINQKESDGQTALIIAASEGRLDFVKLLIDKGADVNAMDKNSQTALKAASSNRFKGQVYKEIEDLLKQSGAR
jgi:ankyrin repeat protein